MTFEERQRMLRVFIDTQIVTCFKFIEDPDKFAPMGNTLYNFVVTHPVVHELERIKDDHWSSGQRDRARKMLNLIEKSDRTEGLVIGSGHLLTYYYPELSDQALVGMNMRIYGPDDRFIASIHNATQYNNGSAMVLSDDVGVRLRAKHILKERCTALSPDQNLRYAEEKYNLPQLVKAAVKELAKELAAEMRQV